jgi:hypothetical protein
VCTNHSQKNELKPWQKKQWVIAPTANAEFVSAMEDVVAETRVPIPAAPGRLARSDDEYERKGPANLFVVLEPLAGQRQVQGTERARPSTLPL